MTLYLSNRDGNGKTSEEGHYKFPINTYLGNVLTISDLVVTQQATPAMLVVVSAGQFRIPDLTGSFAYTGWSDGNTNVSVSTADPANPRISAIVLYVDKTAATSASPPNNPGIVKFMAVNGTAAATPVIPNSTAIQAAVGAGNPYIILASAKVLAAGTSVVTANIVDLRTIVTLAANLVNSASLQDNSVTTAKLPNSAVSTAKVANGAITTPKLCPTYIVANGSNGASRQLFPAANTTYSINGTVITYTSGPSNEVLDISGIALINPSTSAGGQYYIAVNGVAASKSFYYQTINQHSTGQARTLYPIAANTTVSIDARFRTQTAAAAAEVCNSSGDQSSVPSFGSELRLIAWGRT